MSSSKNNNDENTHLLNIYDATEPSKQAPKKIFAKHISDQGLVPRTYTEFTQRKNKKTNNPIKNGQKIRTDTAPKKIYEWQRSP